jgi:hypothetical protein
MNRKRNRASVIFTCRRGHEHRMCVTMEGRQVHPRLTCPPEEPQGYGPGGGSECLVPQDLPDRVERELRDSLQEHLRRGFVLIAEG